MDTPAIAISPAALLLVLIPLWLLVAWGASVIARNQGENPLRWFVIGLMLGPFSWLAAHYSGKVCIHCRSRIHRLAMICPRCQRGQTVEGVPPEDLASRPEARIAAGRFELDN